MRQKREQCHEQLASRPPINPKDARQPKEAPQEYTFDAVARALIESMSSGWRSKMLREGSRQPARADVSDHSGACAGALAPDHSLPQW
jgi:hypothetical protein